MFNILNKLYKKIFECVFILFIFVLFSVVIKKYFTPFLFILFLTIVCSPITSAICKVIKSRKAGAFLSLIIVNILLGIMIFSVGNHIYEYLYSFITKNYEDVRRVIIDLINYYNETFQFFNLDTLSRSVIDTTYLRKGALYTTDGVVAYFIANMATYFILSDKYDILNFVKQVLGNDIYTKFKNKINQFKNVLHIEIKLVLISGIMTTLGLYILRIPRAFTLGVICGILDILPYVGTIIVFIPLLLYNILIKRYFVVIGLVALYVFVEIIRQILETKFISNKLEIHPLAVLVAVYIGIKVFGLVGIITGPLYVIVTKEILISE